MEQQRTNDRGFQAENELLRDKLEKLGEIVVKTTDSGEGGFDFILKCI